MKKIIASLILVFCSWANAGLFGPSTFEECVLDQMKDIKSDAAANAVTYACRSKFPSKQSPASTYVPPEQTWTHLFTALGESRPALNTLILKMDMVSITTEQTGTNTYGVKSYDYGHHLAINITNRQSFPINTIQIGIPKKPGSCSWDADFYSELYECQGSAGALRSGQFKCNIPNIERRKISVCLVGFGFVGTETEASQFMQKYGIPKRKN